VPRLSKTIYRSVRSTLILDRARVSHADKDQSPATFGVEAWMAQFRFRIVSLGDESNQRGLPMVRVRAKAVEGEAFASDTPVPKNITPCEPDGTLDVLVSESFVHEKRLTRGALVDPTLRVVDDE
jgi:hypothetical protein